MKTVSKLGASYRSSRLEVYLRTPFFIEHLWWLLLVISLWSYQHFSGWKNLGLNRNGNWHLLKLPSAPALSTTISAEIKIFGSNHSEPFYNVTKLWRHIVNKEKKRLKRENGGIGIFEKLKNHKTGGSRFSCKNGG